MKTIVLVFLFLTMSIFADNMNFYKTSYDCTKVKLNSVEYEVCQNKKLANLDIELNWIYLSFKPISKTLKQKQRQWNKEKNQCQTTECIENIYRQRIKELYKASSLVVFEGDQGQCQTFLDDYYKVEYVEAETYDNTKQNNPIISKCDATIKEHIKPFPPSKTPFPIVPKIFFTNVYQKDLNGDGNNQIVITVENHASFRLQWRSYYEVDENTCNVSQLYSDYIDVITRFIKVDNTVYLQEMADGGPYATYIYDKKLKKFHSMCRIKLKKDAISTCKISSGWDYCERNHIKKLTKQEK